MESLTKKVNGFQTFFRLFFRLFLQKTLSQMFDWDLNKKKLYGPFFIYGIQLPQGQSHFKEAVYFLPLSSHKFLVLILSTSEGSKAESNLEPPSGFKHGTPGLRIQHLNLQAIKYASRLLKLLCCGTKKDTRES